MNHESLCNIFCTKYMDPAVRSVSDTGWCAGYSCSIVCLWSPSSVGLMSQVWTCASSMVEGLRLWREHRRIAGKRLSGFNAQPLNPSTDMLGSPESAGHATEVLLCVHGGFVLYRHSVCVCVCTCVCMYLFHDMCSLPGVSVCVWKVSVCVCLLLGFCVCLSMCVCVCVCVRVCTIHVPLTQVGVCMRMCFCRWCGSVHACAHRGASSPDGRVCG